MSQSSFARRKRKYTHCGREEHLIVRSISLRVFLFTLLCDGENIQTEQNRLFIFVLEFVEFLDCAAKSNKNNKNTYIRRESIINMQELITIPRMPDRLATDTEKKLRSIFDDINSISKTVLSDQDDHERPK